MMTLLTRSVRTTISAALATLGALAAPALIGAPTATAQAQSTATTLDTFQLTAGTENSPCKGVADAAGNLYFGGYGTDAKGVKHWIVRKSADNGATWSISDNFQLGATYPSVLQAISKDAAGNVLAAGYASDGRVNRWIVRRISSGGTAWSTIDNYTDTTKGVASNPFCIGTDSTGHIYVGGSSTQSRVAPRWFVRMSSDGGQTWRTVDDYALVSGQRAQAVSMVGDAAGAMYIAGFAADSTGWLHAIIRKSADGGLTWSTISNIIRASGYHSQELLMAYEPLSNALYAYGSFAEPTATHYLLRKSLDGGTTWTQLSDTKSSGIRDLVTDQVGNVYITGSYTTAGVLHLFTSRSADSGLTWTALDDFQLVSGRDSIGKGLIERNGSLYTVGMADVSTQTFSTAWFVRRL